MGKFDGKVAIITGGSAGIGLATAIMFAKEGGKIALVGRTAATLAEAAKKCREVGSEALEIQGDVSDMAFLDCIIDKTVEEFGGIDVLVNNAAAADLGTFDMLSLDKYNVVFNTNVRAPLFLSVKALPHLKISKGCIVNVSSVAGGKAEVGIGAYALSKAALDHFARCLAAESVASGVRVNNVSPGSVKTGFLDQMGLPKEAKKHFDEKMRQIQPLGHINPEQVAEAILFLASAEMVTGIVLTVNAGYV